MLRAIIAPIVGLAALAATAPSFAQDYPTKPIKIVVPFAAGGPADIYARFIGARLHGRARAARRRRGPAGRGVDHRHRRRREKSLPTATRC